MMDLSNVLSHWEISTEVHEAHPIYMRRLMSIGHKAIVEVFFSTYGKWRDYRLGESLRSYYNTEQEAMDAVDLYLIENGYILLSKERTENLRLLL